MLYLEPLNLRIIAKTRVKLSNLDYVELDSLSVPKRSS